MNDLDSVSWDQLRNELHSQRMMGMALDAGGHLTHGFRPNISGKLFDQASYGVDSASGLLDYGAIAAQVREFRPLVLVAGYSAYPRNPNFAILAEIAHDVGATSWSTWPTSLGWWPGKCWSVTSIRCPTPMS